MNVVLALAIIILMGVIGGKLARHRLNLPSVTGYIFIGILLGPSFLNFIGAELQDTFIPVKDIALGILAVAIGGELRFSYLQKMWGDLCRVFFIESLLTLVVVASLTTLISGSLALGLILGTLALASAPNTTIAVFREYKLKGDFPRTVLSLVALDNLFCLLLFGLIIGFLGMFHGGIEEANTNGLLVFLGVLGNLFLSFFLGVLLGMLQVYLNRTVKSDNELLVWALGLIFLGVGASLMLGLQPLFTAMVMGLTVVNMSPRPQRFFNSLRSIDTPILIIFLTLAGAKINLAMLYQVGFLGLAYILARFVGKVGGSYLGGSICPNMPKKYRKHLGPALTPQAGVAVGLSLMVERTLPIFEGSILAIILGAVIVFEVIGPLLLKKALMETDSIDFGSQ